MDSQDGTSESAPMVAGVLALATQLNHGRNIGPINPVLYGVLGPLGQRAGISDVVSGNNSVTNPTTGQVLVPGFTAGPGFDVASGWGTLNASVFVPALVLATAVAGEEFGSRARAAFELRQLEHSIRLSSSDIGPGGTSAVTDGGFLPGHPVKLMIDGQSGHHADGELGRHGQLHAQPVRAWPVRRAPCADAPEHADHHHGGFHEPVS
jgi:hypothetical protein